MKDRNREITFLSILAKYADDIIHDVAIDLTERNYRIESTNTQGRMVEAPLNGSLRRKKIRQYQETLSALDLVSWPVLEEPLSDKFPTIIDQLVVVYTFDDENEQFETTGRTEADLKVLHKATEELISHTFGSYEFYKE